MRRWLPFGGFGDGGEGLFGGKGGWGGDADKLFIAYHDYILHGLGGSEINGDQFGAVGWGAKDFTIKHVGPDVGGIFVNAGDEIAAIGPGDRRAKDLPFFDRGDGNVGRDGALEQFGGVFAGGEVGV